MHRFHCLPSVLIAIAAFFCAIDSAMAASPSVTAVLSNSDVLVGETVQLEIRVTDASDASVPKDISADGLEIHQTGTSRQFEMHNFTATSSTTYNYTVLPLKAGTFRIPSQTIRAGNNSLRTPELTLRVAASPARQSVPNVAGPSNVDPGKLATAELIVPKKTAYVGEMIPVVVRIASAARIVGLEPPEIVSQGFTIQKLQANDQPQIETINGRQWQIATYKTAVAATRSGKLEIGPVKVKAVVVVPASRTRTQSSRRSPFDIFNTNDPFSDPFFSDPFGRLNEKREIEISSEPAALEVKALPPNPPANFSGAVGTFTMAVEAKPKSVQVGDPITVTATISGRGNFDRVNAPALEDERGWHKYPPSAKFKQDDEVGISGAKTFETVVSPNENKQALPPLVFSYFDPAKERYATLQSDAVPIHVEGGASTSMAAAPAQSAAPAAVAPTKPTPKPADILYQLSERPSRAQSFTPLFAQRDFWLAQTLPFLVLIGLIGWNVRQARSQNREAQRIAVLQHEITDLTRKLRRSDASPQEYFSQASRLVQVKAALAQNLNPNVVDSETAAGVFRLDEAERQRLRELFRQSDEFRYSGVHNGGEVVPRQKQREVLDLIDNLRT